jgi:hypothetical protein
MEKTEDFLGGSYDGGRLKKQELLTGINKLWRINSWVSALRQDIFNWILAVIKSIQVLTSLPAFGLLQVDNKLQSKDILLVMIVLGSWNELNFWSECTLPER